MDFIKTRFYQSYEKYFFYVLILVFLIPLLFIKYFPTVDGPAHLYNANLLRHLWLNDQSSLNSFFDINSGWSSNWINHLWDVLMGTFLPSWMVEKSLLIVYVVLLPLSFRYLVKNLQKGKNETPISVYLIFPFIYSFPLCIGFYNFCIGLPILLFALGYWIKNHDTINIKKVISLLLLSTLLYFSHLFNFLLFGLILLVFEIQQLILQKKLIVTLRKLLMLLIACLPGLALTMVFAIKNYGAEKSVYLPMANLVKGLSEMQPLITINYEAEKNYISIVFWAILIMIAISLFLLFREWFKTKRLPSSTHLLISAMIVLLMYFTLPDWMISGGFISIRLSLYFFLLLILWIAAQQIPSKIIIVPVLALLIPSVLLVNYHYKTVKVLSADVEELMQAEPMIEAGKTVLPLNYSGNWLHSNFSNYLASQKFFIVLDNYEATKPHFPLQWKKNQNPYELIGDFGNPDPCISIEKYEQQTGHSIDYISRWYYSDDPADSCKQQTATLLNKEFTLIFSSSSKKLELFKRIAK